MARLFAIEVKRDGEKVIVTPIYKMGRGRSVRYNRLAHVGETVGAAVRGLAQKLVARGDLGE